MSVNVGRHRGYTRAEIALWDLSVTKTSIAGAELLVAVDNLADSRDPNAGQLSATGRAMPICRPEIGRTMRAGLKWSWMK